MTVLSEAALLASLADETPEGRSIVALAREKFGQTMTESAGGRRDHSLHRADAHLEISSRAA